MTAAVRTINDDHPTSARPPVPGVFRSPGRLLRLTRQHACCATPGCAESIYSDGGAWRHQRNGQYACPSGAGWAEPFDPIDADDRWSELEDKHADELQEAAETAEEVGRENGFEEGKQEGLDEGVEQGRKDMYAEIDQALNEALDVKAFTDVDRLREALASAWNKIAP